MTLREALEQYKGIVAKIGADTAYIYCDTITDETPLILIKHAQINRCKRLTYLAWAKERLKHFDEYWKGVRFKALESFRLAKIEDKENAKKEKRKPQITKTIKQFSKELTAKKGREKENLRKSIKSNEPYVDQWDYLDREVKEIYNSYDEEAIIILFEGDEVGKYWTSKEYRAEQERLAKLNAA